MFNSQEYLEKQIKNAIILFKDKVKYILKKNKVYAKRKEDVDAFIKGLEKTVSNTPADKNKESVAWQKFADIAAVVKVSIPLMNFLERFLPDKNDMSNSFTGEKFDISSFSKKLAEIVDAIPCDDEALKKKICNYIVCKFMRVIQNSDDTSKYEVVDFTQKILRIDVQMVPDLEEITAYYHSTRDDETEWTSQWNDGFIRCKSYVFTIPEYLSEHGGKNLALSVMDYSAKYILPKALEEETLLLLQSELRQATKSGRESANKYGKICFLLKVLIASWENNLTYGRMVELGRQYQNEIEHVSPGKKIVAYAYKAEPTSARVKWLYKKMESDFSISKPGIGVQEERLVEYYASDTGALNYLKNDHSAMLQKVAYWSNTEQLGNGKFPSNFSEVFTKESSRREAFCSQRSTNNNFSSRSNYK